MNKKYLKGLKIIITFVGKVASIFDLFILLIAISFVVNLTENGKRSCNSITWVFFYNEIITVFGLFFLFGESFIINAILKISNIRWANNNLFHWDDCVCLAGTFPSKKNCRNYFTCTPDGLVSGFFNIFRLLDFSACQWEIGNDNGENIWLIQS
jgi:hypothetical protein